MSKNKTILVTGAAGFIGSHLCHKLINEGCSVIGVDNLNLYYSPKRKLYQVGDLLENDLFNLEIGDITNKSFLDDLFKKYNIDAVAHLAARAGVRHSIDKPLWFKEANISGTINLLELAKQYNISNFIYASSSSVYGETNKVPFTEDQNTDYPISPYSASKKTGELFCYTYSYLVDVPITVIRFFNVIGPGMRPELAIPLFTDGILRGTPIKQFGDGSMERNYTYIDDIVDGVIKAIKKPTPYIVLNLGGEKVISLKELIETLEKICGKKAKINVLPKPKGDVSITYADCSQAKNHLGWAPKTTFKEGCQKFYDWYLAEKKKKKKDVFIKGVTKKLLIFSLNYHPFMSGAEVAVKRISDKIDHYSYDLICARFRQDLAREEKIGNIQVYRVGLGNRFDKYLYPFLAFFKGMSLKMKNEYDIIWGIMASYAGFTAMIVHLFTKNIKYVLSLQKGEANRYFFKYTWFWYPVYRMIYSQANMIQATSSFHEDRARKHGYKGQVQIIPNGVISDIEHKYSSEELGEFRRKIGFEKNDIVLMAKTTAFKRDNDVRDAMEALRQLDQRYKLMVLGPEEAKETLESLAREVGIEARVRVVAYKLNFDLIKYLKISNLFLKISRGERLGTSLMEAMLSEVPIIASDVAGVNDIIIDQQNGSLCRAGDINDIVVKIKKIMGDKELRHKLIKEGFSSVERKYDWESVAEGMKTIFEKV